MIPFLTWPSHEPKAGTPQKVVLPPFSPDDASSAPAANDSHSTADSWEHVPDDMDDPRYDRHGFRRDAARLAREEAFQASYAARLEQQEARWARRAAGGRASDEGRSGRAELKRLVRIGVPAARRKVVWPQVCRAGELRATCDADYFEALLAQPAATSPDDPGFASERQIDLDLARTFPGHRLLSSAEGSAKLRSVLVAYARRDPSVGYVQGMGFVAAMLLVFVEEAVEAFWCLCALVETLLPPDFYSATLLGLRIELAVFADLLALKMPKLAAHLDRHAVSPELFATRWYVAIFANALPVETTLRVWDAFLHGGIKVLHRVSLSLLRVAEPRLLSCHDQQEMMCILQEEQANCLDCERLLSLAFDRLSFLRSFPVSRVKALRRKHRSRLLAAEGLAAEGASSGSSAPPPGPCKAPPGEGAGEGAGGGVGGGVGGDVGSPLVVAAVAVIDGSPLLPWERSSNLDDDSSDGGDDEYGDGEAAGEYAIVSHDDLAALVRAEPVRSFWL